MTADPAALIRMLREEVDSGVTLPVESAHWLLDSVEAAHRLAVKRGRYAGSAHLFVLDDEFKALCAAMYD